MNIYCPNKNTAEFKRMEAVLGDENATNAWHDNLGQPIWNNNEGKESSLWAELLAHPRVPGEAKAMQLKSHLYTKPYKAFRANSGKSVAIEPTLSELIEYINASNANKKSIDLYKKHKLVDINNSNKRIKWAKTDANYKKVLAKVQNINKESSENAKISEVTADGRAYYTILLSPKTAFTTADGEQVAFFDATTGEITFTEKGLTAETVIHEFAHPFVDALAKNNPALFNNLLNDIQKDAKVPEIKKILDHVDAHYAKAGDEIRNKELIAYVLSEYGQGNIDPATGTNTASAIKKFYDWVSSLAKDIMELLQSGATLYVDQIHPKTKYKDVANLFTVYSELGGLNLGVSATEVKKITPESITNPSLSKKERLAAKRAVLRGKGGDGQIPPAHKMVKAIPASFVEIKDEAAHMATLLPKEIAIRLAPGYLKVLSGGRAVVGMFENAMISLSEMGPKGTAYHEGFHAVFRTLLSSTEQKSIIAEARKIFVSPTSKDIFDAVLEHNISNEEAEILYFEEQLADAFAVFMEAPYSQEYSKGILGFFQRLGDWLTKVFSNRSKINKLFKDIQLGSYTKQTPNIVRGVAYKVHSTLSVQAVSKITRELTAISFENINTIEDLAKANIDLTTIAAKLMQVQIEAEDANNFELVDRIDELMAEETDAEGNETLDIFWLREIDYYMRNSLGLKATSKKTGRSKDDKITEEDQDEQNADDLDKMNFLRSSYEVSGKVNATAAVKFMVAMTEKTRLIDSSKPTSIDNITNEISTLTGLPILVDFGMMYNDLENILSGVVSVYNESGELTDALESMLTVMKGHSKYKPELLNLASKLDGASEEIRTQFFSAFSRQKGSFVHHQVKGKIKRGAGQTDVSSEFTSTNFSTKSVVIRNNWVQAFSKRFGKIEEGNLVYDTEVIENFFIKRARLINSVEVDEINVQNGSQKKTSQAVLNEFQSILEFMGVTMGSDTLNYLIEKNIEEGFDTYDLGYSVSFAKIMGDFLNATNDLAKREGPLFGSKNHIMDNGRFFKDILAEADAYFKKIPGENAFVGPEGNSIYAYQDNDLTSKAVNQFKAGDLTHLNLVKNSAYGKHSVWVGEMLDPINGAAARKAFALQMYGNLKSEETAGDVGAKASELKTIDSYMDIVNKQLSGYYVGLAEADKSRQTYFKGPKLRRSEFTINAEGKYVMSTRGEGAKILKGYLADELSRMSIAHSVIHGATPTKETDWVLNYHYYSVAPGEGTIGENLDKIPGNAFQSFLFPDADFTALGLISPDGTPIVRNNSNFWENAEVNSLIVNSFATLVRKEIKYAHSVGLLDKTKDGAYVNRLISSNVISDPKRRYKQGDQVDIIRVMADYVLNSMIGNIEQTKMFNGDPAAYKVKGVEKIGKVIDKSKPKTAGNVWTWGMLDLFGDFKKRIPAIFASGKDFRIFNKKDGTPVVRSHYTSATIANITVPSAFFGEKNEDGSIGYNEAAIKQISEVTGESVETLKELFSPYLAINQTDAQAWITLDAYRERMNGLGKWTPAHDIAYEEAMEGKNMSAVNVKLLAQPLKTVHAELVLTKNGELLMQYNKQSEAVLLPFMKNTELGQLMEAMENPNNPIDHVIVLDGKKAGAQGIVDITDGNGNILAAKDIKMNSTKLSYNNLFLQQDLPTKLTGDKLLGSQVSKNVLSVVTLDGKYFNDLNGQQVVDLHHSTIGRLSDKGLITLDDEIDYDATTNTFGFEKDGSKKSKVHSIISKELEGEITENSQEALAENLPFDTLPIKTKIMNKLMAIITKKTVRLKQQGAALIQLSNLGFIGSQVKLTDTVKNGIIWFKDPTKPLLPMHIAEGVVRPAQILMPHSKIIEMISGTSKKAIAAQDMLEAQFGTRDFKNLTHIQLRSIMETELLQGLSYRIPNQGASSNDAFEIVGILPIEMGDTMIAFADITTKTGSDFDIDKAFVVLPNFYFDEKAGKIRKTGYDLNNLDKASKSSLENLRLDLMREMLMHPSAYASVMAPLDDDSLEKFIKALYPESTKMTPMEFFSGRYQLAIKSVFDGAKSLVGSIANHMTNHSLSLSENLSFNNYYLGKGIKVGYGDSNLSNKYNENGKEISGVLGAYMNAIVDAAKDPFIVRANLNQYTAGTTFMLIRAGFDEEWVAAFTGQPIIKAVVDAQNAAEGRFGGPVFSTKQNKFLSPVETVLEQFMEKGVSEMTFRGDRNHPTMRYDAKSEITTTTEQLQSYVRNQDMESGRFKAEQLKVLKQFLEWQVKAGQLADVIKVSKADVDGATKTLMTAQMADNLFHKILNEGHITNLPSYFGVEKNTEGEWIFHKGAKGKMIGRYFENSVQAGLKRFSRFFIAGSKASQKAVENIAGWAGYTSLTTNTDLEKLVFSISNEVYSAAAADTRAFTSTPEEFKTLFFGSTTGGFGGKGILSLPARVEEAKSSQFGENLLINGLQFRTGRDGAPDKIYLPNTETVKETKEALFQAWDELLGAEGHPEIQQLAEDLIKYSFYTSGFSKSVGDFSEHIPTKWLKLHGFHEDIKRKNIEFSDPFALVESQDKIIKNLYKSNQLVPTVKDESMKHITWGAGGTIVVHESKGFMLSAHDSNNYTIEKNGPHGTIFKRFVKRKIEERDYYSGEITEVSFQLYKLAGYTTNNDAVYLRTNMLGMSGGGNNVKEYIGDGKTSIFPGNNVSLPEGLQKLTDLLEQRGLTPEDNTISFNTKQEGEIEDRIAICIMRG